MLTLIQRAKIGQKKKDLRISNKDLATFLNVKYGTLTMVLCGSYSNKEVEKVLLEWLKQK